MTTLEPGPAVHAAFRGPPDRAPVGPGPGRVRVRPSTFGVLAAVALPAVAVVRPGANDPELAAMTWVAAVVVVLIGLGWPLVAVRSVRVASAGPVADADVGNVVSVPLAVSGAGAGTELAFAQGESGWYRAAGTFSGSMGIRPAWRGVRHHVDVDVRTAAPFGFLTATRTHRVSIPRPWYVGPSPGSTSEFAVAARTASSTVTSSVAPGADLVRSLRPYRPGDPANLVHWPTTARTGQPVVRELDDPTTDVVVLVLDLSGRAATSDAVEEAVRRADGIARGALGAGTQVLLATCEDGRSVCRPCRDRRDLRRRLAAAGAGPVEPPVDHRLAVTWVRP